MPHSCRSFQAEVARLTHTVTECRSQLGEAERRAEAEAGFRKRAEQGWLEGQQAVERVQASLYEQQEKAAAMKGKLQAVEAERTELERVRSQLRGKDDLLAVQEKQIEELSRASDASAQQAHEVFQQAQHRLNEERDHLRAESDAELQAVKAQVDWHRGQAQRAHARGREAACTLEGQRGKIEGLMTRLVTAKDVSDLSDQTRLLFDVKAALLQVCRTVAILGLPAER